MKVIYKNKTYEFVSFSGLSHVTARSAGKFYNFRLNEIQIEEAMINDLN